MSASDASGAARRGGGRTPHGVAQRRELVLAAFHLIAEKGFEGLRTRDVAQRADVNIATLHYYFHSKEDLIRAVVEYMHERFASLHEAERQALYDQPLEEFRHELADVVFKWRTEPQLYIVMVELFMRAVRDPVIQRIMADLDLHWHEYIKTYVTRGVAQGVFRQDSDIDLLVTS